MSRSDRPDWCRCQRRTGTRRNPTHVQVPPVLLATWRDEQLVDVRRVHSCGMADEILDPADGAATIAARPTAGSHSQAVPWTHSGGRRTP